MSGTLDGRDIDDWMSRALHVLDRDVLLADLDLHLYTGYGQLGRETRGSLSRFCPFRSAVLRSLRACAAFQNKSVPEEGIALIRLTEGVCIISKILRLAGSVSGSDCRKGHRHFNHQEQYTLVVESDREDLLYIKLIADPEINHALNRDLEENCAKQLSDMRLCFGGFNENKRIALDQAFEIIRNLLPTQVGMTVASNVSMMFFARFPGEGRNYENGLISAHHPLLPGSLFLSDKAFSDIGNLIELVYHEALHNELEARSLASPIYRSDFSPTSAPRFKRSWGNVATDNNWSFDRALHAFYVYSHLTLLMRYLRDNPSLPDSLQHWGERRLDVTIWRASVLGKWLLPNGIDILSTVGSNIIKQLLEKVDAPAGASWLESYAT